MDFSRFTFRKYPDNQLIVPQEEYLRAYYAAILESQQKASQAAATANEPSDTAQNTNAENVAEGSAFAVKKEDGEEDDDDVEWEDAPAAGIFAPNAPFSARMKQMHMKSYDQNLAHSKVPQPCQSF